MTRHRPLVSKASDDLPASIASDLAFAYRSFVTLPPVGAPADAVFEELDGSIVRLNGRDWGVTVFSVTDAADARWIQFALGGETNYMLTVRLERGAGADRALSAVSSWLADPTREPRIASAF